GRRLVVLAPEQLADGTVLDGVVLGGVGLAGRPLRLQSSANALRFGFVPLITGSGLGTVAVGVGVGVAGLMGEVEDLVGGVGGFLFPALRRGVILPPVLGRGRM